MLEVTPVQPTPCAGVTPVVAPGTVLALSRECRSNPVSWSLLQSSHARESKIAPVVAWMRVATPSGAAGRLRSAGLIIQGCHAPCEISRRNVSQRIRLSRETDCGPDAGASRHPASLGRPVRRLSRWPAYKPCLSREAGSGRRAERQRTVPASLGRHGTAVRQRRQPATPKADRRPPGWPPATQLRSGG